jgi:hypothetical protein
MMAARRLRTMPALRVALVVFAALLPACASSRTLFLDSEPSGATVVLDGQRVGTTPYQEPIPAWGTRSLVLELPGHERFETDVVLETPWYDLWPIDFIFELLWPWSVVDDRRFTFALRPAPPLADDWAMAEESARRANAASRELRGE